MKPKYSLPFKIQTALMSVTNSDFVGANRLDASLLFEKKIGHSLKTFTKEALVLFYSSHAFVAGVCLSSIQCISQFILGILMVCQTTQQSLAPRNFLKSRLISKSPVSSVAALFRDLSLRFSVPQRYLHSFIIWTKTTKNWNIEQANKFQLFSMSKLSQYFSILYWS